MLNFLGLCPSESSPGTTLRNHLTELATSTSSEESRTMRIFNLQVLHVIRGVFHDFDIVLDALKLLFEKALLLADRFYFKAISQQSVELWIACLKHIIHVLRVPWILPLTQVSVHILVICDGRERRSLELIGSHTNLM